MENYYIYVYCDPRDKSSLNIEEYLFEYSPFYIGYGIKNRLYYHLKMKDTNHIKINKIKSILNDGYQPIIYKIKEGLSHEEATQFEKYFIKEIGTLLPVSGVKKGLLTNLTPGGDGGPTFFNRKLTEEHKDKIRKGNTNQIFTAERIKNITIAQRKRTIIIDENKREKMINGIKNMKDESRLRISKATKDTIWIFNDILKKNKRIHSEDLNNYLKDNWNKGFRIF